MIDHGHYGLRRDGKADADRTARRRNNRRFYPDHFAVQIKQRSARIAAVDSSVGLNVVVIRPRLNVAIACRDDAGGHRAPKTKRVSDRDDPFAQPQLVAITEFYRLERFGRRDLEQSQIGFLIAADDFGLTWCRH